MPEGAVNFFNDGVDDVLLPDQVPAFDGGQFSNLRGNLLQPNQSKFLGNCDIDKLGKLRTRRGTTIIGPATATPQPDPGVLTPIQGLTSYQTPDYNYVVAAHNGKIWKWADPAWVRIAQGGVADNDEVHIYRAGVINNAGGYPAGTTVLTVDGITGIVDSNEHLYFTNNLRTEYYEYTIASASGTPTTSITLEEPGLVFDVEDNWGFVVARPARINNAGGYAGGYTGALAIDGYTGTVNVGETFVIRSENVRHEVVTASGSPTTSIATWKGTPTDPAATGALQGAFVSANTSDPIVFAQGNDMLFFSDGIGPIYAWHGIPTGNNGGTMNLNALNTIDWLTGSNLGRAATAPPTACHILLWFQNRLIASGVPTDPDAIFFSDYFNPTAWDRNYQMVRIGGGESDPITGLTAWTDYNMLVFKKNSIYVINLDPNQNPTPDDPTLLVASFSVKQLHKLIGCPAPFTAMQVGGGSSAPGSDVFFVDGDKKLHSVRRVMAAETQQEVGTAISLPVQDLFDKINLLNIHRCVAMYHNEHYIFGGPSPGFTYPNACVAYNVLTQSWCGLWTWKPTCFSRRSDFGAYSKLIFGDTTGVVVQWMDDLSLEEETPTTYQDRVWADGTNGIAIPTQITTRAFTFGDMFSFKTGLSVEFEFDESVAGDVVVKVILDKTVRLDPTTHSDTIAIPFSTLTEPRLRLPSPPLPFTLPLSPDLLRLAFDLQRYGTFRELQFQINTTAEKLAIRSIRITGFMDSIRLQTIPVEGVPELGIPPAISSGGP